MNIKGLLIGSAAAMVAVSGAQAADAIIFAEPEPLEYVRICDTYGAGFFYIPGTQNCLQVGGYVRAQINGVRIRAGGVNVVSGYDSVARFAPSFDARTATEWGTLRAFGQVFLESYSGGASGLEVDQAFIELEGASGTLLIGRTDTPYARFLGFGAAGIFEGDYAWNNQNQISYTFDPGNGFSAILGAVDFGNGTGIFGGTYAPNFEGGLQYGGDWGSVGAVFGYDTPIRAWGAQAVARVNFDPVALGVHVLYANNEASLYGGTNPFTAQTSRWSVLAHAEVQFTEQLSAQAYYQWWRATSAGASSWQVAAGLGWTPVDGLVIRPELAYTKQSAGGPSAFAGALRFQRNF